MSIEKTDTAKSPLLKPVVERDYTKGISLDAPQPEPPQPQSGSNAQPQASAEPKPEDRKFNIPTADDTTKEFSFNDIPDDASDISADDHMDSVNISGASAKSFANFAGDALKLYLPKLTYNYCKVDIENVIVNVEKGNLMRNWIEVFNTINERTEKALDISDEEIKMWKKACKDWLESEQITFANPKNAFLIATFVILLNQGVKAVHIRRDNERYMREAIAHSNPATYENGTTAGPTTTKENKNESKAA